MEMKRLVVLLLLSIGIANIDCKEIKKYSEENVHELKDIGLFYIDGEPSLSYYDFADFCISKGKFDLIMENNMDIYIKAMERIKNSRIKDIEEQTINSIEALEEMCFKLVKYIEEGRFEELVKEGRFEELVEELLEKLTGEEAREMLKDLTEEEIEELEEEAREKAKEWVKDFTEEEIEEIKEELKRLTKEEIEELKRLTKKEVGKIKEEAKEWLEEDIKEAVEEFEEAIEIFENGKNASSDHSKKYSSFFNEAVIYMRGEEYAELIDLEDRFLSKFGKLLTDEEKDSLISINVLTNDRNYMNEKIKNGEGDLPFVKFLQKSFKDIEETGDEYYFYKYLYERKPFLLDLLSE